MTREGETIPAPPRVPSDLPMSAEERLDAVLNEFALANQALIFTNESVSAIAEEFDKTRHEVRDDIRELRKMVSELSTAVSGLKADHKELSQSDKHLSQSSLESQKQIAELWQHLSRQAGAEAGGVAGKESAEASGKKWTALYALIALITTLVNSLITGGCQASTDEAASDAPVIKN